MGEAAKLFTRSLLMGLDSSVRKEEFAEPSAEDIENMSYHEAVEYLKKRDVIKKIKYDELSDKMKFRAFTASRITDGKILEKLNAEMIANVNDGKGLKDFLAMTKTDILDKVGMGPNQGWYWETVYRTNVQTAYNVGRAMGFDEDKPLALELVIIDDARTSDICRQYAGKPFILPYDHPFWQTHWPPFHFNCRTTVRAIYDENELPEEWSNPQDIKNANNGFGSFPLENDSWWNELESQVRQAKALGVQGEIEAAKEILIDRTTHRNFTPAKSKEVEEIKSVIPKDKLVKYCLNPLHTDGQHKARKFKAVLGYTLDNWEDLQNNIYANVEKFPMVFVEEKPKWGNVYRCDMLLKGPNGNEALVRTGWILRYDSDVYQLTTAYVL